MEENPYAAPPQNVRLTISKRRPPSVLALAMIVFFSIVVSVIGTPADPYSLVIAFPIILTFGVLSYFAGYSRNRQG